MDDAFNYFIYHQLSFLQRKKEYTLRSISTGFIANIGNYDRQYAYRETEFIQFDKFLFKTWEEKINNKDKKHIPWGVNVS